MSAEGIEVRSEVGPFAVVPEALIYDGRLSAQAVRLWAALDRHANRERASWPSRRRLAGLTHSSPATVDRSARELEAAGWLRIERRPVEGEGGTHYLSSRYVLTISATVGAPVEVDPPEGSSPVTRGGPPVDHPAEGGPPVDQGRPPVDQGWSAGDDMNESQLNEKRSTPRRAPRVAGEDEVLALVEVAEGGPWTNPPADAVRQVFTAWAESVGREAAPLDRRRRQVIERALTTHPLDRVLLAVRGWRYDRWTNGDHDGVTRNQVSDLLGDADKIDRYAAAGERGALPTPRQAPRRLSAHEQHQADLVAAARAFTTSDPTRMLGA